MDVLVTDPIAQWLAGIFGALAGEIVKAAAKDGKEAFAKWLDGARGEEVKALRTALALALNDLEHNELQGESFVAFLEQRQKENDTLLGDALLRALLIEPHGFLSLTPNLQDQVTSDLQPLALKFLSLFHQKLWSQSPFDKLLAAKAAQDELRVALESLEQEQRQTAALERLSPPPDYAAARRAYLEFVIRNKSNFIRPWIIALPEDRPLKLDDVYVSLMVERESLEPMASKTRNADQKPERINVAQAIKEHSRLVIKGDPGAGKSTCTRFLDLLFASAMWQMTKEDSVATTQIHDKEGKEYGQARLPILVRIADYAAERGNSSLSLRDYLPMAFRDVDAPQEVLSKVFTAALREVNALVLLDGLDEVAEETTRSEIAQSIKDFVDVYPNNHFVATSRIAGYVPLAGFVPFTFSTVEGEQLGYILWRWYVAVRLAQIEDAASRSHRIEDLLAHTELYPLVPEHLQSSFMTDGQQFAEEFDRQLNANSGAQRLMENPLTLTMLVELRLKGEQLATHRSDLYEKILTNLLDRWEKRERKIAEENLVPVWEAEEKLAPLAYWMHTSKTNQDPKGSEIEKELAKLCAGGHKDAADLWRRLREFTPLFMESSHGRFRFAHRTFQEYFVAKELLRDETKAADLIYRHRYQPNWEEPILLALSSVPDATDLIRTAILANSPEANEKNFRPSDYDDVLHRDFFFAVRCVADGANIDDALQKEMGEQLVEWWYEFGTWPGPMEPWRWQTWESMEHAVRFTLMNLRGTKVSEYMRARFLEELAQFEKNPFEPQNNRLTQGARFEWMQNPYHTFELWMPYRGLVLLEEECTPQVINFFMRLMRTHHTFAFSIGKDEIEDLMKKEAAMKPALEEMLKGDQESKLFAAILLGEYKKTTPEALKSLFDFYLEDAGFDEEQEGDSRSNRDWQWRDRRSELRRRKKDMQFRALNALLTIENPLEGYSLSEITPVLWSVIKSANERIESFFKAHAEELTKYRFYRSYELLRPYDLNRLTAAFLLVKLDNSSEALNILQNAILKPIDNPLALYAARRFAELQVFPDAIINRALEAPTSDDWETESFTIDLIKDLKCKHPALFARLFDFLSSREDIEREKQTYREQSHREHIKRSTIKALYELGDIPAEYLPKILELIGAEASARTDEQIRWVCVKILAENKIVMPESTHRQIAETLFHLFRVLDPERDILEKAEEVLGQLAISPTVMPLMLDSLKSRDTRLVNGIDWAMRHHLGKSNRIIDPDSSLGGWFYKLELSDETIRILLEALTDANPRVNEIAGIVLAHGQIKSPELVSGLRALLQHPDPWVRYRAMDRLLWLEYKENDIVETWLDLMESEDEELRAEAAEKISRLPSSDKLMDAAWSLASNNKSVRVKAECFMYLVKLDLDNDKAINLLVPPLEDDVDLSEDAINNVEALPPEMQERLALKVAARSVLHEFDELPPKVQAALVRQTLSPNPTVRKEAIESLRLKASLDIILARRLFALLDDKNNEVCQETCELIGELFGKYPVGFMDERKAIAEKLYRLSKEKRVHPIPTPPPASGPNVPFIVPTSPVPVPSSELAEPEAKVEHGTFYDGEGAPFLIEEDAQKGISVPSIWGALWAVAATLAPTNQKPTTV